MTRKRDIPELLSAEVNPGKKKIEENISVYRDDFSVSLKLLELKDQEFHYPFADSGVRKNVLGEANEYLKLYKEATGRMRDRMPSKEYFLTKAEALAEIKYTTELYSNESFLAKVKPFYIKQASYTPKLLSGLGQKGVPYLYGAQSGTLLKLFYDNMKGVAITASPMPDDYNLIEVSHSVIGEKFPSNDEQQRLKKALGDFAQAIKAKNLASSEVDKYKKKGTPEEKKSTSKELEDAAATVEVAKASVRAAGITWPAEAYQKVIIPIVKYSDCTKPKEKGGTPLKPIGT
jgi:hypothetical protein